MTMYCSLTAGTIPALKARSRHYSVLITNHKLRGILLTIYMVTLSSLIVILLTLSESYFVAGEPGFSQTLFSAGMTCVSAGALTITLLSAVVTVQFITSARLRLAEISKSEVVSSNPEFTLLSHSLRKASVSLIVGTVYSACTIVVCLLIGYHPGYPADQTLSKALALVLFIIFDGVELLLSIYIAFV